MWCGLSCYLVPVFSGIMAALMVVYMCTPAIRSKARALFCASAAAANSVVRTRRKHGAPPPSQPRLRRPARPRPRPTPAPAHGNAGQETRALSAATTSDDGGATDASPPWPSARAMQRAVRRFASGRPARCRSQQWFLLLASIQLLHQHHTFVQLRPVTHQTGRRLLALD